MLPAKKQREFHKTEGLFKEINKDIVVYQTVSEFINLWYAIDSISEIKGDMIEVGVFQGGTAKLILETNKDKELYLFDTFTGFVGKDLNEFDFKEYKNGDCKAPIEIVKKYLADYKKAHIVKGRFPDTGEIVKDKKFAFAHIDVDIHLATKESLEFIYPRMTKGGVIAIHDYPAHPGVKLATDDFLKDKLEKLEVKGSRQCLIKKL